MQTDEILVVPDVHGRTFWKKGTPNVNTKDYKLIVFLGDYLDPYPKENIKYKDCLDNFKEIIQFKKDNPDRVVLLLGNHDLHYMTHLMGACRRYSDVSTIREMFINNGKLFKMMHTINVDNTNIVFSHSAIIPRWIELCNLFLPIPDEIPELAKYLNELWKDYLDYGNPKICGLMSYCSWFRGGSDAAGSPVWADIREACKLDNWYQVFGHTQLAKDEYLKGNGWVDTDCRRCFHLNELL